MFAFGVGDSDTAGAAKFGTGESDEDCPKVAVEGPVDGGDCSASAALAADAIAAVRTYKLYG